MTETNMLQITEIESEINKYLDEELPKITTPAELLALARKMANKYISEFKKYNITISSKEFYSKYIQPKHEKIKQKPEELKKTYYNLFREIAMATSNNKINEIKTELLNLTDDMVKFKVFSTKEDYKQNIENILSFKRKGLIKIKTINNLENIVVKYKINNNLLECYYKDKKIQTYTKYTYDKNDRLIIKEYYDFNDKTQFKKHTYEYYKKSTNLKCEIELDINDNEVEKHFYDKGSTTPNKYIKYNPKTNLIIEEEIYNKNGDCINRRYDENGKKTRECEYDKNDKLMVKKIYNNNEKLEEMSIFRYEKDLIIEYGYNNNNKLIGKHFYNKDKKKIKYTKIQYNNDQILEGLYDKNKQLQRINYYDKNCKLEEIPIDYYNYADNKEIEEHYYDENGEEIQNQYQTSCSSTMEELEEKQKIKEKKQSENTSQHYVSTNNHIDNTSEQLMANKPQTSCGNDIDSYIEENNEILKKEDKEPKSSTIGQESNNTLKLLEDEQDRLIKTTDELEKIHKTEVEQQDINTAESLKIRRENIIKILDKLIKFFEKELEDKLIKFFEKELEDKLKQQTAVYPIKEYIVKYD